jgi:hypothetical protein
MTGVSRIICLDLNKVFPTPNGGMLAGLGDRRHCRGLLR